jgi:hypothetical protein
MLNTASASDYQESDVDVVVEEVTEMGAEQQKSKAHEEPEAVHAARGSAEEVEDEDDEDEEERVVEYAIKIIRISLRMINS